MLRRRDADLVGDEVRKTGSAWSMRLGLYAAALCLRRGGAGPDRRGAHAVGGVAGERLAGALGPGRRAGRHLRAARRAALVARRKPVESAFDNVKKQLSADMAMLREVSAP